MQNEEKQNFDDAPKTVWLDKYQIPVYTDLKRADEILYATDTQLLKRPKTNYFALADLGAPAQDIAKKSLSGIPFSALSAAAPFGGAGILLAKTPFMRGIYKSGIDMTRQAAAATLKDAGTAAAAFGQDIDTRLKRDAQIDRDLAQRPASIRWQEKFMQNYKASFSMLGPVDINRVNERLKAWENEQNKIDEFNGKVKTVVDLFTKRAGLDKTEKDGFWYDLGSGAGSFLFSVGALAVTRNPALVAPIFGLIEGQGSYEQAVEAGVEPVKAYGLGKANSAWITATELVGEGLLNKLLFTKGVMGRAAQRILKRAKGKAPTAQITLAGALGAAQGTAIEGTQEAVQSVGSNVILNLGGAQEKDVHEIALESLYEGLIGGLMGAFGGAAGGSANYARYAQNVKERFTQIGIPEETAQRLAHEIALEAVSSELTDDTVAAVSGEINSPLTAQDRDPQAFKAALTDAQKREIDKNAWAVGERVEQQALAAGVTSEEAAASGRVAQALANGIYRLAKLTPTEQEHFKISILNGSNQMEGTPAFAQAAMYKNKRTVEEFVDFVKKGEATHPTYIGHTTPQGNYITLSADVVLGQSLEKEDYKKLFNNFDDVLFYEPNKQKPTQGGYVLLGKLQNGTEPLGIVCEFFNSGEFKILDLFKDKPNSVDNWIKQKTAGTRQNSPLKPVPLKQALMGRLGNNLSGRRSDSIGKNEEKIKSGKPLKEIISSAAYKTFEKEYAKGDKPKAVENYTKALLPKFGFEYKQTNSSKKSQSKYVLFKVGEEIATLRISDHKDLNQQKARFSVDLNSSSQEVAQDIDVFLSNPLADFTKTDIIQKIKGETYNQGPAGSNDIFSVSIETAEKFRTDVKNALQDNSIPKGKTLDMGEIPHIYVKLGLPAGRLKTNKTTLLKAIGNTGRHPHNVPVAVLENLPTLLADPKAIFKSSPDSTNPDGFVVVLDALNEDGKPIVAIISPSKKGGKGFWFIPSVYDRNNFENFVWKTYTEQGIKYIKEKGSDIWGTLQSRPRHNQNLLNSIKTKEDFVKAQAETELLQENFNGKTYNQNTITVKHSAAMYRNPEFKAWFGKSKLVDDAGNPLVVYHGTNQTFNEFKINPLSKWLGKLGEGIYFTDNPQTAQGYGEDIATDNKPAQVYPVYLRVENPLVLKDFLSPMPKDMSGYDGVICGPEGNREIVVFSPEQIKSVNNSGTWNPQTTNIYEQGENPTSAKTQDIFFVSTEVAEKFRTDVKSALADKKIQPSHKLDMGPIPQLYVELGLPPGALKTNKMTMLKAIGKTGKHPHNVPPNVLENLPALVADPQAVLKSLSTSSNPKGYIAVLNATDDSGKPIIAVISPKGGNNEFSFIPSVYERNNFDNFLNQAVKENGVLYIKDETAFPSLHNAVLRRNAASKNSISTKKDIVKGETYKQNIRGNVTIDEAAHEAIIRIFKDADPSTIVHELAHVYLSMIQRAATVSADAEFAAFMDDLNAWLGEPKEENGAYSRQQQEMFASGFEAYLAEGKAPNKELESVFEKFAKWLAEVYESVKDYLQITPQVRSIFDRLLAPAEPVLRSKVGDKLEAAKQLVEQMKKGRGLEIEGLGLADIKDLLKTLSVRKPAAPKTDLLKDLRKHGVNYANAGQIDKEAYKNARVYDKKDGVDDRPDVWLSKLGYMDVDESTPETLAEAYDKIQRALDGEKVYRLEDQTAAESRAAYEERLQTILQIFPDVKTAQEALKSIAQLEEMGYRAVEKRDIASFERLLAELENLVTTKQDTKEGENAFKAADRLRREVINEIQKRSLAEKQIMLDWLNKAKTTEEIREATGNVLEFLEKQYAKTDEAKAEAEMLAIPKTNYGALKIKILKSINDINEQAAQEVKAAQARLAEFARAETRGLTLNSEELNERARLRGVLEKQLNEPYRRAILAALAGIRHLPAADKGKFMRTFMGARAANFLPQEIDDILRRAKDIEETNYKKHLDKRIRAVLAQNLFDKTGSLKRALLDAQTMNAIGQLKDVLKKSPEEAAQELQERIIISMANPGAVSTTDKIVNELLSIVANGAKESSMELYKQTFDDITALRKAGRSAMNLQKMVRDFRTEADKQEVLTALKKNKEHGLLKRLFLGHIGNWESFLDLSTSKEIKEKYSMLQEESDCIAYTWTRRRSIEKAAKRVYRLNSHAELGNKINELLKETDTFMNYALVDNNPDPAAIRKVGEVFPEKLNKMQLINAYIYCKNDILRDRLIKQYGKEQLQDMLFNRLSAQDRAFGDLLQKEAEDSYQMINRVFVRERGYDLPKTQAYFPSRVTRVESDIDLLKAAAEMSKNPSFTKFRSGSAAIQMELGNPLDILFSHIEKAAEYAYKSEKINRIRRVFMSSQLKPWFEKVLTKDGYNVFVNMIENISTDKTKAQHDIDKLGDWLTNNYVRGAIALKPTIAIKQLISAMNYAENMPSTQWVAGFVKAVAHPKETVQFMLDADPYLRARYESGSMNEGMEKMMAAAEAFNKAQKVMSLTNLLSISTRLGDIGAIVFGGKPYVDYLMSQKGMSKEEAIKECRKSTLRSQQFNGKSSLSRHQINGKNGGYIVRALLAFRNTPAQYARKIAEAIAEFQRGEITAAQLGKTVAIYALFNNWAYSLVTSLSVLAKLLGEDEEADEMLFNDFILSPFTQMASALPILSEASNFAAAAVSSKVFDHKVNLNNVGRMPVLSDLVNLGAKAIKENKSAEDVLNMFFTSVQYGLGLPAHYLGALPSAAKDMAGANPMRGFLKALGYTKYRAGKITGEEE